MSQSQEQTGAGFCWPASSGLPGGARREEPLLSRGGLFSISTLYKNRDIFKSTAAAVKASASEGDAGDPEADPEPVESLGKSWKELRGFFSSAIPAIGDSDFLHTAVKAGKEMIKASLEIANDVFGEDAPREDILKFNGYSIRVLGTFVTLDSLQLNPDNGHKFRLKLKVTRSSFFRDSLPDIRITDNKWTMTLDGLSDEALIEISTPEGVNTGRVTWSGLSEGSLIVECP